MIVFGECVYARWLSYGWMCATPLKCVECVNLLYWAVTTALKETFHI